MELLIKKTRVCHHHGRRQRRCGGRALLPTLFSNICEGGLLHLRCPPARKTRGISMHKGSVRVIMRHYSTIAINNMYNFQFQDAIFMTKVSSIPMRRWNFLTELSNVYGSKRPGIEIFWDANNRPFPYRALYLKVSKRRNLCQILDRIQSRGDEMNTSMAESTVHP